MATRRLRDPFSGISHMAGGGASIVGMLWLLWLAGGSPVRTIAFTVYGLSLIWLYTASAVYHSVPNGAGWPQRLDHMAIYVVIAGTYTPICLIALPPVWGYPMLAAQWILAIFGIVMNLFFGGGPKRVRLVLYLAMGWMALIALHPLEKTLQTGPLLWLLAGGLSYTIGTIVYATNRPRLWPGKFGAHDLWHLFVLAGTGSHFIMMLAVASVKINL